MRKNLSSFIFNLSSRSGFTLVELLLVMALIGVLVTVLITLINPVGQFQRSRDSQRKNDLAQIQRALEQYYNDYGKYPCSTGSSTFLIMSNCAAASISWGGSWVPYMDVLPKDPVSTQRYVYRSPLPDNQEYYLYAHLERGTNDSQICKVDGSKCDGAPVAPTTCGDPSDVCNYGVSSSNVSP